MDISKYSPFFHDGSIIDIKRFGKNIEISMQSAEMHAEDFQNPIILSRYHRIKGKLHIEGLISIKDDKKNINNDFRMLYDGAGILHLELFIHKLQLDLEWKNYPPHPDITAYSFYEIEAEKIWWENIPDLKDPFW